jgi:CRISPR-associated exonuclease Cas4
MVWFLLALALLVLGLALLWLARHQRNRSGVPTGRIVYADMGAWQRCEHALFSARQRITGKPDYLVEEHGRIIPVEVKPGREADRPYEGDVLQLAAYCLLVEEEYGQRPPYGLLKYRPGVWRIDYTPELRQQLLARVAQMRADLTARDLSPNHHEAQRCQRCGQREHCSQRLA